MLLTYNKFVIIYKQMEIEFWCDSSGDSPVIDFIKDLSPKSSVKIYDLFEKIEERGWAFIAYSGMVRKLRDGLYEFKVRFDRVFYRFIFIIKNSICYILNAFKKKTNKTPNYEINLALRRAKILALV